MLAAHSSSEKHTSPMCFFPRGIGLGVIVGSDVGDGRGSVDGAAVVVGDGGCEGEGMTSEGDIDGVVVGGGVDVTLPVPLVLGVAVGVSSGGGWGGGRGGG